MSNCDTANNTSHSFPTDVGILALELYFPNQYVDQKELEKFDEVSAGKYTIGLGQDKMGFCSDREDIHSLCLTVTHKLMEKHNIDYKDIGRLEVGTETILDKSKSVKTVLMQLFEKSGNTDIEGVDTTNACYGGTAALFNAINWIESSSWDGRLALVIAADIAVYASGNARPTGGAGAIAILIGPYAPLVIERGLRSSHSAHVYDFYKPDMESEYARVDGQLSIQCYLSALDKCYQRYKEKATKKNVENISLDSFDGVIFHSPYCKLVQKSLARLLLNDVLSMNEKDVEQKFPALKSLMKIKLEETYFDREIEKLVLKDSQSIFDGKTKPSLLISNQVGNMYTPSVYGGLVSYLLSKASNELCGNRLCLFSYGSGLQASLYSIRITSEKGNEKLAKLLSGISDVPHRLSTRQKIEPKLFSATMLIREKNHHLAPYEPISDIKDLFPGTYYLASVDEMHRRKYCITDNYKNSC